MRSLSTFSKGGPRGGLNAGVPEAAQQAASPSPLPPARRPGKAGPACRLLLLFLACVASNGCAASKWTVRPHQRELLADRIMKLDGDPQEKAAEQHILENREGAVGGSGTSGGGCGCN